MERENKLKKILDEFRFKRLKRRQDVSAADKEMFKLLTAVSTGTVKIASDILKAKREADKSAQDLAARRPTDFIGVVTTFAGAMAVANQVRLWISEIRKINQEKNRRKALAIKQEQLLQKENTPKRPVGRPRKS